MLCAIIEKAPAWGFRVTLGSLLPSPCKRATPQPRPGYSPLLVPQRGLEPRRACKPTSVQSWPVYRFRHCGIVQQEGAAFLNGGRPSLCPLTQAPRTAYTGCLESAISAQNGSKCVDRDFASEYKVLRQQMIVQVLPVCRSAQVFQYPIGDISGGGVFSLATSTTRRRRRGGVDRAVGQQRTDVSQLPASALLCRDKFLFPESQSRCIHELLIAHARHDSRGSCANSCESHNVGDNDGR